MKKTLYLIPKSFLNPRAYVWTSEWYPILPHCWVAQKRTRSGITLFEVEAGNADIVRGQKAKPQFDCALDVLQPSGYAIVQDCERPWPDTWPPTHCAFRRYAIWPSNKPELQAEAIRLAQGVMDSKAAAAGHARYGPAEMPMPKLSHNQRIAGDVRIAGWLTSLRIALKAGYTVQFEDSEDGLLFPSWRGWRPDGIASRGAPAGSGIWFWTGYEWSAETPAYLWLRSACTHERAWHAYDRKTGEPVTAEWYGDPGPMYQQCTGDPNNGWLPEFRGVAQHPDPIIPPYDSAHSIRGFRHLVALSEMSDSPMVLRSLRSRAAQMRLQCSEIGPHPSSNYAPPSLRTYLQWAKDRPNGGFFGQDTGRQFGWPALVIAQSLKKGAKENLAWCKLMVEVAERTAMPNGIFSRCASAPGSVWYDPDHDTAHGFEVPIFWMGVTGCARQARIPVPRAMSRAMQSLLEDAPLYPYYNGQGPPNYAYVARRGGNPYTTIPGGKNSAGDSTHMQTGAALAASQSTNVSRWIAAARRIDSLKVNALQSATDLREGAGLLAQMQRGGGS